MRRLNIPALGSGNGTARSNRTMVFALLAVLVLGIATLVSYARDLNAQLRDMAEQRTDNLIWFVAQMEIELTMVQANLLSLPGAGESSGMPEALPLQSRLARAAEAFDIFYSRVDLIDSSLLGLMPERDASILALLESIKIDKVALAELFDDTTLSPRELRAQALPLVIDLAPDIRSFSLAVLRLFAERSSQRRTEHAELMARFSTLAILIVALLSGTLIVVADIYRNLRRRSEALARVGATLNRTIEAARDAIIVTDAAGRIRDLNPAAVTLFGYPRETAVGRDINALLAQGEGGIGTPDEEAVATLCNSDGETLPVEVTVITHSDGEQSPVRIVFLRDISERLAVETTLRRARDAAERNAEARARFLAVMSHEMRTPLQGVLAALDLMDRSPLASDQRRHLGVALRSGLAALDQVENLLDLARRDTGLAAEPHMPFDPVAIATQIGEQVAALAAERNSRVTLDLPDSGSAGVIGPRRSFEQALGNLASNAVKFTRDGEITIRLIASPVPQGRIALHVAVEDTGIGIAAEDQARIFADFETIDSSLTRSAGGTGLGLGIARRAVDTLGGRITLRSSPGLGSCFCFAVVLPSAMQQAGTKPDPVADTGTAMHALPVPACATPLHILLAEDNAINSALLSEMLCRLGHRVTLALDGHEAIARAGERAFDLIVMDISMPGCDGIAATRKIRATPGPSQGTPVMGLTAHALPEDLAMVRAAGIAPVLSKPVRLDRLAQGLELAIAPPNQPLIDHLTLEDATHLLPAQSHAALIDRFESETAALLKALPGMGAQERREALHTAAGSAAMIGARRLRAAILALHDGGDAAQSGGEQPCTTTLAKLLALTVMALRTESAALRAGCSALPQMAQQRPG